MQIEELDLPVGRNHAIIVKNFCRLRHTFCEELLAEKEGMDEKRMEILLKVSYRVIIMCKSDFSC